MCEISNKLKLCSCKTKDVEKLKHYWVLSSPHEDGLSTIGLIMPPVDIGEEVEKLNIKTLTHLLNSGNCFDVTMLNRENDILELNFTCRHKIPDDAQKRNEEGYIAYSFVFKNGKWRNTEFDPFGNNLMVMQTGKISRPFSSRNKIKQNTPGTGHDRY